MKRFAPFVQEQYEFEELKPKVRYKELLKPDTDWVEEFSVSTVNGFSTEHCDYDRVSVTERSGGGLQLCFSNRVDGCGSLHHLHGYQREQEQRELLPADGTVHYDPGGTGIRDNQDGGVQRGDQAGVAGVRSDGLKKQQCDDDHKHNKDNLRGDLEGLGDRVR